MRQFLFLLAMSLLSAFPIAARNSALLIGIGHYDTLATGWAKIHGNNDVTLLQHKLEKQGFEVATLTDSAATKAEVMDALHQLVSRTLAGDQVYLHFSGHGQLIEDVNGDEELDQSFVCYNACFSTDFNCGRHPYKGQHHLIDDELFPLLDALKQKVGKKGQVMLIFDTCYSRGADRGDGSDDEDEGGSDVEWLETTRGTSDEFLLSTSARKYFQGIEAPGTYSSAGGRLTVISACESDKRNYECRDRYSGKCYGSLSFCLAKLLDRKLPMSHWGKFFQQKKYMPYRIFRPSQHPVVEFH